MSISKGVSIGSGLVIMMIMCSCGSSPHPGKKAGVLNNASQVSNSNDNSSSVVTETGAYRFRLNPVVGSTYSYTISSESEITLEVNGKSISNKNKADIGLTYHIQKDSAGNFLLHMRYDKIHIYTKAGDKETDADADHAVATLDPVEKMLGLLKTANITGVINPAGKVIRIDGYTALAQKIMAGLNTTDEQSKSMAQVQLDKVIGDGLVRKSIDQVVNILPDSAIHIGDTWSGKTVQKGELTFNVKSNFKLKDVDDGIATIESKGEVASDKVDASMMGQSVTASLNGDQQGKYEIEAQTGMLLKNKTNAKMEGTIQMMGRDIPVTIETTLKMDGGKVK